MHKVIGWVVGRLLIMILELYSIQLVDATRGL